MSNKYLYSLKHLHQKIVKVKIEQKKIANVCISYVIALKKKIFSEKHS